MTSTVLIWLTGVALIGVLGAGLTARHLSRTAARAAAGQTGPGPLAGRLLRVRDTLVTELGRGWAALAVLAAGSAATFAIGWPAGRLAHALEDPLDWPMFRWASDQMEPGTWTSVQDVLTQMGNRPEIKAVAVVAAVVLAVAWRRRWWMPVVLIAAAFFVEKYVQAGLARVVDRGHPPTTMGTYPSGGCARLISIYGTILFLALRTWRPTPVVQGVLWTLLAEAAWLEGYARTYRLEHWFTDVLGGWLVGALLLVVFTATAATLAHRPTDESPARPTADVAAER